MLGPPPGAEKEHEMKKIELSPAALWASAFALMGLIVVQGSGLTGEARADVVAQTGPLTALTVTATNEDILLILDSRTEDLYVYRPDRNALDLVQSHKVADLFNDARARTAGTRR
jgi:hypothetical protein